MRTDKAKNIAKVAKALLENPLQTEREIADNTWVSHWTAHNLKAEVGQIWAKDWRIIGITDKDLENIEAMQAVVASKIRNEDEMKNTRIWELAQAMREATARYSLFRWNATDEKWWMKLPDVIFQIINPNEED